MRGGITTEEATRDRFLFLSYCHKDAAVMKPWVDFLTNQGVRVWWDRAFQGGDDWLTIAKELLSHDNCCGFLFFASPDAISSMNTAEEWRTASKTKQRRADGSFYAQIVMATDDPSFNYKSLTDFVKKTEDQFSDEDFDDFRALFGQRDHIYYSAHNEEDKAKLLKTIKERAPQAVDEHQLAREKLSDVSSKVKLGTYGADRRPLFWECLRENGDEVVLLCDEILAEDFGGQHLKDWLQDFVQTAFSAEEQQLLPNGVRLLTVAEAEGLETVLTTGRVWWLADCDGNLQAVVREDGTVYTSGYNNRRCQKGIRPVITPDNVTLCKILG